MVDPVVQTDTTESAPDFGRSNGTPSPADAQCNSDAIAMERLIPIIYEELRVLASAHLRHERPDHTLQPTALINEVFLKLANAQQIEWRGKAQFMALAARQIRQILIDHARKTNAPIRPPRDQRVPLDDIDVPSRPNFESVNLALLDKALEALGERSPRQANIVVMRYFGGMGVSEVAQVLGISERTVKSEWQVAKAWLYQAITQD